MCESRVAIVRGGLRYRVLDASQHLANHLYSSVAPFLIQFTQWWQILSILVNANQ